MTSGAGGGEPGVAIDAASSATMNIGLSNTAPDTSSTLATFPTPTLAAAVVTPAPEEVILRGHISANDPRRLRARVINATEAGELHQDLQLQLYAFNYQTVPIGRVDLRPGESGHYSTFVAPQNMQGSFGLSVAGTNAAQPYYKYYNIFRADSWLCPLAAANPYVVWVGGPVAGSPLNGKSGWSPFLKRDFLLKPAPQSQQPFFLAGATGDASPANASELAWLNLIFLDGGDVAMWSEAQRKALDAWVAYGGLLFLDAEALGALEELPLAREVRVDAGASRRFDLTALKGEAQAALDKVKSELTPAGAAPTATPVYGYGYGYGYAGAGTPNPFAALPTPQAQSTPQPPAAPLPPAWIDGAEIQLPDEMTSAPRVHGILAHGGSPPALASWRHGLGRVAVQAFAGVGDEALAFLWVSEQRSMQVALGIGFNAQAASALLRETTRAGSPAAAILANTNPSSFGEAAGILFYALRQEMAARAGLRVMVFAMLVFLAAPVALYGVFAFSRRPRWKMLLFAMWILCATTAVAAWLLMRRGDLNATALRILVALPDTPWRLRMEALEMSTAKQSPLRGRVKGDAPLLLARAEPMAPLPAEGMRDGIAPAPFFGDPIEIERRTLWPENLRLGYQQRARAYLKALEPDAAPGVRAEFEYTTDTLRGKVYNDSPYALRNGRFIQRRGDYVFLVRLPDLIRPGGIVEIDPWQSAGSVSVYYPPSGRSMARPSNQFPVLPFPDELWGPMVGNFAELPMAPAAWMLAWVDGAPVEVAPEIELDPKPAQVEGRTLYAQIVAVEERAAPSDETAPAK